jgi:hypothetical protein
MLFLHILKEIIAPTLWKLDPVPALQFGPAPAPAFGPVSLAILILKL